MALAGRDADLSSPWKERTFTRPVEERVTSETDRRPPYPVETLLCEACQIRLAVPAAPAARPRRS